MTLSIYKNSSALSQPRPQIGIVTAIASAILTAAILVFLGAIFYWNVLSPDADCADSQMTTANPPPARIEPPAQNPDFFTDAPPPPDCEACDSNLDPR